MTIRVSPIPALESNYIWMIHDDDFAVLVDPGCDQVAMDALQSHQLELSGILITHHHHDHIGGVTGLLSHFSVPVFGPQDERITLDYQPVKHGDTVKLDSLGLSFEVIYTPGHTRSHIIYANDSMIFAGDTLFSMGCGRLFEGTAAQMQQSLDAITQLNPSALLYCGHEYTQNNTEFALSLEPSNRDVADYLEHVKALRQMGQPTLPVALEQELRLNPFLRTREPAMIAAAKQADPECGSTATEVFAILRELKDHF